MLMLLLVALFGVRVDPAPAPPTAPPSAPGVEITAPPTIGYEATLVVTVRGLTPSVRYTVATDVVGEPHTDCVLGDSETETAAADGTLRVSMVRRGWPDVWCTGSDYAGTLRTASGGPVLGAFTVRA